MLKHRNWQKGGADLVSVAIGMMILSIVVAGTSAALVFGREAMLRQEHYKTAAYLLRGKMEEQQLALQIIPGARDNLATIRYAPESLDAVTDRGGVEPVYCTITRDRVQPVDLPDTRKIPDWYLLTMRARWQERRASTGGYGTSTRQQHEIVYTTAVNVRD